jgi:hypothetical protein
MSLFDEEWRLPKTVITTMRKRRSGAAEAV